MLKRSWLKPLLCDGQLFICGPDKLDLLDCAVEGLWGVHQSGCRNEKKKRKARKLLLSVAVPHVLMVLFAERHILLSNVV